MKVIITGSKDCKDYEFVKKAIDECLAECNITPSEIVSGHDQGVERLAEKYAKNRGLNLITFQPKWNELQVEGANIKTKYNPWKKVNEKYNANAGFIRNQEMVNYADALIVINTGANHFDDLIKKAKVKGITVYQYTPKYEDFDEIINFWEQ